MSDNWQITDEEFWTEVTDDIADVEAIADLAEDYTGYEDSDFAWVAQRVADRIFNIHLHRNVNGEFIFSLTCNADGEIDGGVVNVSIPQTSLYLTTSFEWKRMTDDRSATGRDGIIAIKHALLDYEYRNARRMADAWGIL